MKESDIQRVMNSLKISKEEAIEILQADEAIEQGEKLFEQTAEQKKASKAMTSAGGGKHKEKTKRERKVDADREKIIEAIIGAILYDVDECKGRIVVDSLPGVECSFEFNGNQYTVKLIKHRKPKEQ